MAKVVPIIGTVGVPSRYGGFETLAEQLCCNISSDDIRLLVYCERSSYTLDERTQSFKGHQRVFLPLKANGLFSLIYDAFALIDAVFRQRALEVFIFGYSGAWILPLLKIIRPRIRFIVNVDGMEWRRDKFSTPTKLLLKALEWCAARTASIVIADNAALAELFSDRYRVTPTVIAYGGDHTLRHEKEIVSLGQVDEVSQGHFLAIARIEPENNSEMIIQGCIAADVPLVFIGNWAANKYGLTLRERYREAPGIKLLDPIYDQTILSGWRSTAVGYIHGHSVGGTNPSLVEALFHTDRLASFDCAFNRTTLAGMGDYFSDAKSLADHLKAGLTQISDAHLLRLRKEYRWNNIAKKYRSLISI